MYSKYIKTNSYRDLFFIFLFYSSLKAKLDGKTLEKKIPSQLQSLFDKATFNF